MDARVRAVIAEIMDIDPMDIDEDKRREEFDSWNSMNHLRLITAVESIFGVQLSMQEIGGVDSPRQLEDLLRSKGALRE